MWFTSCFCGGSLRDDTRLGSDLQPIRVLGRGAAGQVWACRSRADPTRVVAVKCVAVDAAPWALQMAQRECTTLALLGCSHVNMLKPLQLVLTRDYVSLVSQHAGGGTLYDYCHKHRLSEDVAAYFFRQLVSVIEYMHAGNVAYRDVKLDNMLLTDSTPPRLVLCDFGTSKTWDPSGYGPHMSTFLGTPGFMAPQVLNSMFNGATPAQQQHHHHHGPAASAAAATAAAAAAAAGRAGTEGSTDTCVSSPPSRTGGLARNSYDATKADVWACGAILHYLLLGCLPYGYSEFAHLVSVRESLLTLWQLEQTSWRSSVASKLGRVSPEAQDLLDQLLQPDEDARITLAAVRRHPWFTRKLPPMYERALGLMERQQAALAAQAAAHPHDGAAWCAAVQQVFALAGSQAAMQRLGAEAPPEVVLDLEFAPTLGRDSVSSSGGGASGAVSRSSSGALGKDVVGVAGGDRGAAALRHMQEVAARLLPEAPPLDRAASLGPAASLGRTMSAALGLPAAIGELDVLPEVAASAAAAGAGGALGFDGPAAAGFHSRGRAAEAAAPGSNAAGLQATSSSSSGMLRGSPSATAAAVAEAAQVVELGGCSATACANAHVELAAAQGKGGRSLLKSASVPCRTAAMATEGQGWGNAGSTSSFDLPKPQLPLVRVSAPAAGPQEAAAESPATPALVTHRSDASFDLGDSPSLASNVVTTAA